MKTCSKCKLKKLEADFVLRGDTGKRRADCKVCCAAQHKIYNKENRERLSAQRKGYRTENREKIAAAKKKHYVENREKIAADRKNYAYGVSIDDLKGMISKQGGVCAICGGPGGKKGLCVDHDHDSRKIRALLCSNCNSALGFLKDSSDIARRATEYLKKHGK